MVRPIDPANFKGKHPIKFLSGASGKVISIDSSTVIAVIAETNQYLVRLKSIFQKLSFNVYETLGQRNLSGFVGEVFVRFLANSVPEFVTNPHADGRPDLIDVSSKRSRSYYRDSCFVASANGENLPVRANLAPYKYGGLEVKTSIGNPRTGYKRELLRDRGLSGFSVGEPRVDYLASITFWGHHTSCKNLIGLYYDYFSPRNGIPQLLAAMHSELDPDSDWHAVSIGKPGSKKTSNTSLTQSGKTKLFGGVVAHIDSDRYVAKLRSVGLDI